MLKPPSGTNWEFDRFTVLTSRRLLLGEGTAIALTSKAFDTLVVLIENRDHVVTKDELLSSVWPDAAVEEGNLTQQIFLLRKALGESAQEPRHIVTVPGHGYRFATRVTAISDEPVATTVSINGAASPPAAPRRRVALTGIGLAVFGVIALFAIVLGSGWMPAEKAGVRANFTSHIAKVTESGKATSSAISRDGRYIAYVENDGDEYSLWLKHLGSEGKTPVVPRQPLSLKHLTFSPDGDYLYFARASPGSAPGVLYRIPTIGGRETPIVEDVDSPISFSPDGREFVFQRGAEPWSHIVRAAAGGGSERILATQKFPARFSPPDWSPDGKVVATVVTTGVADGIASRSIVLLPLDNGSSRELYRTNSGIGRLRWAPDGSGLLTVMAEGLGRRQFGRVSGGAIWRIEVPSGRVERLTSDLTNHDPCCLDVGADGTVVANVVNTLVSDLWIAPADRLDARKQVTSDHPVVARHSWLPDNDTVVYRDLSGRINAVNREGRAFSLPVPGGAGGVSACGDGRYVVFGVMQGSNIWRVTPNAGGAKRLTSGFNDFNPACSPDGKSVLYASRGQDDPSPSLWQVSIEGGTPTPLNLVASFDVMPSPSGRMIYYTTDHSEELRVGDRIPTTQSGTPLRQNRWVVISSSDQKRLFAVDAAGDGSIGVMTNWAPDESGLDYVVTQNGVSNIWRQLLTGGQPVQITSFTTGRIFSFAWSPDGQWLSFGAGHYRSDVVVMSSKP